MKLYVEHVRLDRQGYTSRGRYFGVGQKLYRVTGEYEKKDWQGEPRQRFIDEYVRADNARNARAQVSRRLSLENPWNNTDNWILGGLLAAGAVAAIAYAVTSHTTPAFTAANTPTGT